MQIIVMLYNSVNVFNAIKLHTYWMVKMIIVMYSLSQLKKNRILKYNLGLLIAKEAGDQSWSKNTFEAQKRSSLTVHPINDLL